MNENKLKFKNCIFNENHFNSELLTSTTLKK